MKNFKLLTIFIVLMLALALVFVSCNKSGDETTADPETTLAPAVTDTPTEPADETTAAPDTTVPEETTAAPVTTAPEETTEAPHVHAWSEFVTVKAPTCTELGKSERSCSCGEKQTRDENMIDHTAGEWVVDKAATCIESGSKHQACSACGVTLKTDSIPALGHTEGEWITDSVATCTDSGSKHQVCSVCGEKLKVDVTPATGHTEGEWIVDKEATAEADGSKHQVCSVCGATIKTEIIASKPHTPGKWVVDKEASCTSEGSKHQVCSECGVTIKTESIPVKAHTEVIDAAVAPTCTETGLTEGKHCSVCNEVTQAQQTVPVIPHTEAVDAAVEATCTKTGLTEGKHCSVCNAVLKAQETVAMKAHTEAVDAAVEATCTKTGLTEGKHCSVCNAVLKAQETVAMKAHTEAVDAAVEATCTKTGLTEGKHCSVCNAVLKAQETVAMKAHAEAVDAAVEATCIKTGLTEGKHCSVCNAVLKAQETIEIKPHTESEWIVDKAATTAAEGSKHIECIVCKTTLKTESIPKVEIPKVEYTVTVVDGSGKGLEGVEVVFTKLGSEIAKVKTDAEGKAVAKLEEGVYGFSVAENDSYFVAYDVTTLTVAAPTAKVTFVPYASSPEFVYPGAADVAPSGNTPGVLAGVYSINTGSLRLPVEKDKMRYVFFNPTEGGIYRFYVDTDKVEVGYYGGHFYVYSNNTGTMLEDGTMELTVLHTQIGGVLVIGYKSTSSAVTECTITIEKYEDIGLTLEELSWVPYKPDAVFEKIETPEGYVVGMDLAVWTPFDPAMNEIQVFFNEKDGYYHLESVDGPVLYVRITSKSSYQDSLSAIVGTSNLGRYIYDENGEFVMKERYNEILMAYGAAADEKYGVYPLDSDLYYILKSLEDIGWYDGTSPNYIFQDEGIIVKPYNGWLFACVYFK